MENQNLDTEKMNAVFMESRGNVTYGQLDRPVPGKGQVLIKVEAAPLNPSDLYCMEGKYDDIGKINYPFTPGWEGSGTVIQNGGGIMGWRVNGKRVAFSKADEGAAAEKDGFKIGGAYAEYVVTNAYQCIPLDNDVSFEEGASFFVNPMTAIGLTEVATKTHKAKGVIQTAACSQLGRMICQRLQRQGVPLINIVRKEEQAQILTEEYKQEHVLNINDPDFESKLEELATELNATCLLDAVGGKGTAQIMSKMPKKSVCVLYGWLSRQNTEIDALTFMGKDQKLECFLLNNWLQGKNLLSIYGIVKQV